jgi:serine/threonine protein phosphatase 1
MKRHIVIGDIHGCFDELQDLLGSIGVTSSDVIVSVGDLVDRGPDPTKVVDFFRTTPNTVVLMGNHERKHVRRVFSYAQKITRVQMGAAYADAVKWMSGLPYFLELPEAIIVHAAVMPGVPISEQREDVLCGSTAGEKALEGLGRWWHEVYEGPKPVVFGHHVVEEPLVVPGRIYGLDTGACHGQKLTALVLPDFTLHSVPARADHWALIKRSFQADVLAAEPWMDRSWAEIEEALGEFARSEDPRTEAYVAELKSWRAAMEKRFSEVLDAAVREAARISPEEAKSHAASALLFMQLRGRLNLDALRKHVAAPRKLAQLSAAFGLPALDVPSPAAR